MQIAVQHIVPKAPTSRIIEWQRILPNLMSSVLSAAYPINKDEFTYQL